MNAKGPAHGLASKKSQPERTAAPVYALVLLTCVSFFNNLDRMVVAILVEPIKLELGLSDSQMGLVSGLAFAIFYATLGIPLARIADRHARVTLISVCLALWSGMTALTGMVRNFAELFLARMAVGVGEAGCVPASHSLIGDLFSRQRRAFAISILQAGGVLGQSAGLLLAGIIAEFWGWRTALVTVGLLGVPLALLMISTLREPPRAPDHAQASAETILSTIKALLSRPPVVHLILAVAVASFGSAGMVQWLPAFFMRSYGLSLADVAALSGTLGVISAVLGTVFGGYVLTRLGPRDVRWELWWPMIVFAFFPLFMLPSFLVRDLASLLVLQVIGFFLSASGGGVALSAMQTYVEPHRRATAVAVLLLMSSLLGLGLGPVVVGLLSDLFAPSLGTSSLRYALIVMLCVPLWSAAHFWLASRSSTQWVLA